MRKVILSLFIAIFVLGISMNSYAGNKEVSIAKSKDIEKMLDLTITDAFMDVWITGFMQMFSEVASADKTEDEKRVIAAISKSVRRIIIAEFPKLKKQFIPLYDEYFTHEDIKKLIKFYQTPIGKKSIRLMPILTKKGMELGAQWGQRLTPTLISKVVEDLNKEGIDLKLKQ